VAQRPRPHLRPQNGRLHRGFHRRRSPPTQPNPR
jgi:hypothetical protein